MKTIIIQIPKLINIEIKISRYQEKELSMEEMDWQHWLLTGKKISKKMIVRKPLNEILPAPKRLIKITKQQREDIELNENLVAEMLELPDQPELTSAPDFKVIMPEGVFINIDHEEAEERKKRKIKTHFTKYYCNRACDHYIKKSEGWFCKNCK